MQNFSILASLCSWAGWFAPYLVRNHKDRFSRIKAHMSKTHYVKNQTENQTK